MVPVTARLTRFALAALCLASLAVGCGATAPSWVAGAPATPRDGASATVPATSIEPTAAPSVTPTAGASGGAPDRPDLAAVSVSVEVVVGGLDKPLWVTGAGDGSGRLFVAEQGGRIRVLREARLLTAPFADLSDRILAGGERGLLGLAFPPGFGVTRSTFYVHYSDPAGDTTIAELRLASTGADTADPATERIVLSEPQPYANHNGGWIGFDPAGRLLIALGDGGNGGDPENRASRLDTILGKILRIDTLGAPAGQAYAIPTDNPYAARPGARSEILHLGLRNPFRASIDPATGTLWIGDVGQDRWEEVDSAPADAGGLDFGWRRWEGRHCYNPATGCDPAGVTPPVTEYGHGAGCSVIGGIVYRGSAIPALRGAYLFSDYCTGTLWAIDAGVDAARAPVTLLETGGTISSIGTDDAGEVYLTDLGGGNLLRLVPAN